MMQREWRFDFLSGTGVAGWVFALNRIHSGGHIGSIIYGNTIFFTNDFEQNHALVSVNIYSRIFWRSCISTVVVLFLSKVAESHQPKRRLMLSD